MNDFRFIKMFCNLNESHYLLLTLSSNSTFLITLKKIILATKKFQQIQNRFELKTAN